MAQLGRAQPRSSRPVNELLFIALGIYPSGKSDSDSGAGTDAGEAVVATGSDSDSGAGTDAGEVISVTGSDSDSGAGTDAGETLLILVTDSDSGTGTDAEGSLSATLSDSDSGTGTDAGESASATLSDSDSGTGTDAGEAIVGPPAQILIPASSANLIKITRQVTAEATFNGVVAVSQNTGAAPWRAVVWDTVPTSPTYYLGKFGQRPYFYSNPAASSTTAITAAANAQLVLCLGGTEMVNFGVLVNPALAGYDVVLVNRSEVGVTSTNYMIQSLTIPMDVTTEMSATCRVRRTT